MRIFLRLRGFDSTVVHAARRLGESGGSDVKAVSPWNGRQQPGRRAAQHAPPGYRSR